MLKSLAAIALIGLTIVIGASANVAAAAGTPDYKGTVTAVSTSILSIRTDKGKTHTFRLSAATTVEKLGNKTTLADVKPGAVAKVEYSTGSDGSLMATTIKIGIATPNGSYFSTKETGPVTTIKQDTLVIDVKNGKLFGFHLAPDTRFERLGQKIPPANVRVGDTVKVKFDIAPSATEVAVSVPPGAYGYFSRAGREDAKRVRLRRQGEGQACRALGRQPHDCQRQGQEDLVPPWAEDPV
jgi:hypothetical protein